MLLSYTQLLALAARGVITNIDPEFINAASIDITLGHKILREDIGQPYKVVLGAREPLKMIEEDCTGNGYTLRPGEFILAQSQQTFNLPADISAEYKLKSSMARIGIDHCLAGWCDAGWNGSVLTLELKNVTRNHDILLRAGDRIGQMIFFQHEKVPDDRSYAARGRYNGDTTVIGAKPDFNPARGTTYDIDEE